MLFRFDPSCGRRSDSAVLRQSLCRALTLAAGAVALGSASSAQAAVSRWVGLLDGSWIQPFNWVPLNLPNDVARFDELGTIRPNVSLPVPVFINSLVVVNQTNAQYSFTAPVGMPLTASSFANFGVISSQALKVMTLSGLTLSSPSVSVLNGAELSLINNATVNAGYVGVLTANSKLTIGGTVNAGRYEIDQPSGQVVVGSGGLLNVTGNTTINTGTTTINLGTLRISSGVNLEYTGAALLQATTYVSVSNGGHLKATAGADIVAPGGMDIGNAGLGSLTVAGSGSTFSSSGVGRWGSESTGNATVSLSDSAFVTVSTLQAGRDGARFQGSIASGATLRTTSVSTLGGGTGVRPVTLNIIGGTLSAGQVLDVLDHGRIILQSGTASFERGASIGRDARLEWVDGGNLVIGDGFTLDVSRGTFTRALSTPHVIDRSTRLLVRDGGIVSSGVLRVGDATAGTLRIESGGFLGNTTSFVGYNTQSTTAAATVTGTLSTWESTQDLNVGYLGRGSLTISSGAGAFANNLFVGHQVFSDGTVTVGGTSTSPSVAQSTLDMTIGNIGTGRLSLNAYGIARASRDAFIGRGTSAVGTVVLSGQDSRLLVQRDLYVGGDAGQLGGSAALTVGPTSTVYVGDIVTFPNLIPGITVSDTSGGTTAGRVTVNRFGSISTTSTILGLSAGQTGVAFVTGAGATWTNTFDLIVGLDGQGQLSILGGGLMANRDGSVGFSPNTANNTVTVSGTNSFGGPSEWRNSGSLRLGSHKTNVLLVSDGGLVTSASGLMAISTISDATAIVTGLGSTWANAGSLSVGVNGRGTLQIRDGGLVSTGSYSIGPNGSRIDIGLGGELRVGMGPTVLADLLADIQTGYGDGSWNGLGITSSDAALLSQYAIGFVESLSDAAVVVVRTTLRGDANLDGEVSFADLLALAQAYESPGTWALGDFDYDGTVGFSDLLALAQNYGAAMLDSPPTRVLDIGQFEVDRAMAFSMVPEPAALGLIGTAMLLGLRRRG